MKFHKRGGVVGDIISGTGGLVILTVVVLVIVSTLLGASLLNSNTTTLYPSTVVNETLTGLMNTTGAGPVATATTTGFTSFTVTAVVNESDGSPILVGNYTAGATGILTNATLTAWPYTVDATYTYAYVGTDTRYDNVSDRMAFNFTEGIDNVSGKLPTILLIGAVVLLFGVVVLLIRQTGAIGIGSESSL